MAHRSDVLVFARVIIFARIMAMATRRLSPADIKRELAVYEAKYGMTSAEFRERYRRGELDGPADYIRWMGLRRMSAGSRRATRSASA